MIKNFFEPKSVALVGATENKGAVGRIVLDNLLLAKNERTIFPVNPKRETILDLKCFPAVSELPEVPDLAVIATSAGQVPDIVEECGKFGIKAMVIISAGFKEIGKEGNSREEKILESTRKHHIRIIGPNCLGVIRPSANLNASFANKMAKPGHIAFLSQSGALGTAVLDWAVSRDIGFSTFISLGTMLDVDFGDMIDYLGDDPQTSSILIYLESMGSSLANARKFMSAARGFARTKPIIVIKPGKFQESIKAAHSHTGAMVGDDLYYEAAFDRAGVVRVEEIADLFNCASILDTTKLPKKPELAIITNAGGPAVLATDALIGMGGKLAEFSPETYENLNAFLPASWSKSNPIDILGDSGEERYIKTIETTLKDEAVSGAVIIYTPQGAANPKDLAKSIIKYAKGSDKPILAVMMGTEDVAKARQLFYDGKIPTYEFPEAAIRTYMYMYQYKRRLEELYEVPEDLPLNLGAPKNYLKVLTRNAIRENRLLLNEEDSKKMLTTYGITTTMAHQARSPEEAVMLAAHSGYPVAMKIFSPDISHKSDVGGVILNLGSDEEVRRAFDTILKTVSQRRPEAKIEGVTIQKMVTGYDYELIVGAKKDPVMGTAILFGLGGTHAEFFKDIAVGLPPLNQKLARRIIESTRTYHILSRGFRAKPPVNLRLLDETLMKVSNMIVDFAEIKELDINPLVISDNCAIALDARIILDDQKMRPGNEEYPHLIMSPYPTRYVQSWTCRDGRNVILRPIRPEDEPLERELIAGLSPESSRYRFFQIIKYISHEMLSRFCNIDYDREMAVIAEYNDGRRRNVGVGRLIAQSDNTGEFAVLVADNFQNSGLGLKLCDMLIGIGQEKGLGSIYGIVLNENQKMIGLGKKLGFKIEKLSDEESKLTIEL